MPNKRLKCKGCGEYGDVESGMKTLNGFFHDYQCMCIELARIDERKRKKAIASIKKKEKAVRAKHKADKLRTMPIGKLGDKCAVLLQKLVRLEAADEDGNCVCTTCGKVDRWQAMQGGHFISRKHNFTKLMPENIHPQCGGCNGHEMKFGDAEKIYTQWMNEKYGIEFVNKLIESKHIIHKFDRNELIDMMTRFKLQIKELEKGLR